MANRLNTNYIPFSKVTDLAVSTVTIQQLESSSQAAPSNLFVISRSTTVPISITSGTLNVVSRTSNVTITIT